MFHFSGPRWFAWWFGLGTPVLLAGAVLIAWSVSAWYGLAVVAATLAFIWASGSTTCCRCGNYGTRRCGLPGLVAPLFWKRREPSSLPRWRIRLQLGVDLAFMALACLVYCWYPPLLPVAVLWSVGAVCLVYWPKRYHGLLHQLRTPSAEEKPTLRSLPVLSRSEQKRES